MLDAPSIDRVHGSVVFSTGGVDICNTKSANICDLIAPLGEKVKSNSDSSTDHATILSAKSGFLSTFFIGKSVFTTILWL
ncbi:hypothetical protein A2U01_0055180 [Trifolium medium]|uniref:Uncharacterized protein n=1 Tax=Trifolium medium TaxID=97028 RepID=A0A392RCU9_9FABA|nr:hypothetical protein [Trifolium medium]